jgi:hypothetical protein
MLFIPADNLKAYLQLSLEKLRRLIQLPCRHRDFFSAAPIGVKSVPPAPGFGFGG